MKTQMKKNGVSLLGSTLLLAFLAAACSGGGLTGPASLSSGEAGGESPGPGQAGGDPTSSGEASGGDQDTCFRFASQVFCPSTGGKNHPELEEVVDDADRPAG